MAINKVKFGNQTLIDLTDTTATADKILTGFGAYGKDGVWMDGSLVPGADDGYVYQDEDNYVVLDDDEGVGVGVTPLTVTENGTYNAGTRRAYNPVTVDVQPTLQSKSVTPTESQQTVTPDTGKDGLSSVTVGAISSTYVGTGISRKSSTDLTVSGATVTAPAGYYSERASKSVATMTLPTAASTTGSGTNKATIGRSTSTQYINIPTGYNASAARYTISATPNGSATTPATTITANPTISVNSSGLITATNSKTQSVTPTVSAGYVSTGTAGTVTVSGSNTQQLSTQAATTITPTESSQTAVTAGKYTTGAVTVAAIPSDYIGSDITQRDSTDLTVSRNTVTAPAGYYAESASKAVSSGSVNAPTLYNNIPPTIQINSSGLITATVPNITLSYGSNEGYVYDSTQTATIQMSQTGKTYTATKQLTTKAATTYTPTTTSQTIASETYLTGTQTISGDSNLVAENIKKDVNIFGVTGTYEGGATYTATIIPMSTGTVGGAYARYPGSSGTKYYTRGDTFGIEAGTVIFLYAMAERSEAGIYVNGTRVAYSSMYDGGVTSYNYTVPANTNVSIQLSYGTATYIYVTEEQTVIDITENGLYNVSEYDYANVNVNILPVTEKDVNFYDYDGTLLYSYTAQEFANLSELPPNPTHTGLISQGWNIYEADFPRAKTLVAGGLRPKFGQCYITDDNKTRLYITLEEISRPVSIQFGMASGMSVTIDWGDGSTPEVTTTTTSTLYSHTYSCVGGYCITLSPSGSGNMTLGLGSVTTQTGIMGSNVTSNMYNLVRLKKVEIGSNVSGFGANAFNKCYALETVTVPFSFINVTSQAFMYCTSLRAIIVRGQILVGAFQYCYSLKHIINGISADSISDNALYGCYSLTSIALPDTQGASTSIGNNSFYNCYGLTKVVLTPHTATINQYRFRYCYGLKEIHAQRTTPPTLGTNAFQGVPDDCIIYVPSASLSDYQTATNWSTYASIMVGE